MRVGVRDTSFGAVMLAAAGLLWLETGKEAYQEGGVLGYGFDPAFFPRILIVLWSAAALLLILRSIAFWAEQAAAPRWGMAGLAVALTGLYVLLIGKIGFLFASMAFMALLMPLMGYRRLPVILPVAVLFPIAVWYTFNFLLFIPLPTSPWFVRL